MTETGWNLPVTKPPSPYVSLFPYVCCFVPYRHNKDPCPCTLRGKRCHWLQFPETVDGGGAVMAAGIESTGHSTSTSRSRDCERELCVVWNCCQSSSCLLSSSASQSSLLLASEAPPGSATLHLTCSVLYFKDSLLMRLRAVGEQRAASGSLQG